MGNNHSTTKEKKDRKSHLNTRSSETTSSNQMDLRSDLFVLAEKWTKLSKVLATEDFVDGGSSNYQVITKSAFENQMHPTASFLGSLLFDHFQLGSSHRNSDKDPSVMTHAAFVSNVTHVLGLNSDTDQGEYYFRVFSKGADTLKEDELLLLLFTTVKIACSATGLSKSISDADQQIFQSVVRTLDPKRISEVELSQFQNWIRENDIHLLNCLHHFVVQSLVTCTGLSNDSFTGFSHMEDDTLPILDQDNEEYLQLNSIALLWLLSCALPSCYIKRKTDDFSANSMIRSYTAGDLSSPPGTPQFPTSLSYATMSPHQFIQQLVSASNLTTWTLLYNSDKHGQAFNRFLHHTLHYSGPSVAIFVFESGVTYCLALDAEWRESPDRFGGSDSVIFQLRPLVRRVESGENLVYLNAHARGSYRGIILGQDPKLPVLKVDSDFGTAEIRSGGADKLECLEVWGCAGSAPKMAQLDQIRWENRAAEKLQKITRPGKGCQYSTDKFLIDLVKNNRYEFQS